MMSGDILGLCDRLLGEVGRRQHRFAWLIDPDGGPGEWLPVDAYYPGRRLVVVLDSAEAQAQRCTELMPEHGLRLLALSIADLGAERTDAEASLREMLEALRLPERYTPEAAPSPRAPLRLEDAFARVAVSFSHAAPPVPPAHLGRPSQAAAAQRAARVIASRGPSPARPRTSRPSRRTDSAPPPRRPTLRSASRSVVPSAQPADSVSTALGLGLALCVIVAAELYFGVERLGMDSGQWELALGLALDACARVLGTVAARRADEPRAAWTCAIAGSPGVVLFTLFAADGPVSVDPAPLAGLLSLLATLLTAVVLLGLLLGF